MNGPEMIVLIVAICAVAQVLRARYGIVRSHKGEVYVGRPQEDADAARLRDEIRALKERIAVLERIATDGSTALDREIEALRERR